MMQDILAYFYPNAVEVHLNNDPTLKLRNRIVYSRPLELYKGIDNTVKVVVKNNNQRPVNLIGFSLDFNLLDDHTGSTLLTVPAIITDTITQAKMKVVSAALSAAGTGQEPGNTLTVVGGTKTNAATFTVTSTKVVSATVATAGSGYPDGIQNLTVVGGTGVAAVVRVTCASGSVTGVVDVFLGGAYTVNPTLTGVDTTGLTSGVNATLNLVMGVNTFTNDAVATQEYTALPELVNSVTSTTGTGVKLNLKFGVESVEIIHGGAGYYSSSVIFTGGSPSTNAIATATLDPVTKAIATITVTDPGTGFNTIPVVSFPGSAPGVALVVLREIDLLGLDNLHYNYSVKATETLNGLEQVIYADDNYGARGQARLHAGHYPEFKPSIDVSITTIGAPGIYTSNVASDTPTRRLSGYHTAQFFFDNLFNGTIEIQSTLDPVPPAGIPNSGTGLSWATVDTLSFTDQDTTVYYNWEGVYTAFRFVITKASGDVVKILYRS